MMDENKKAAQKKKVSHFITIAVLVILFLAFIFPFIMVIFNAFKTKGDILHLQAGTVFQKTNHLLDWQTTLLHSRMQLTGRHLDVP